MLCHHRQASRATLRCEFDRASESERERSRSGEGQPPDGADGGEILGNPADGACATLLVGLLNRRRQYSLPPPQTPPRTWNCCSLCCRCLGREGTDRTRALPSSLSLSLPLRVCLFIVAFWEIPDASNGLWRARTRAFPFWRCIRSVLREPPKNASLLCRHT